MLVGERDASNPSTRVDGRNGKSKIFRRLSSATEHDHSWRSGPLIR